MGLLVGMTVGVVVGVVVGPLGQRGAQALVLKAGVYSPN